MSILDKRKWICFFSQSGSEILNLSKDIKRFPDLVVTNQRPEGKRQIIDQLLTSNNIVYLSNKPGVEEYREVLEYYKNPLVTLHGWLRIVPDQICNNYEVYNGHPGLPELGLIGSDPQKQAFKQKVGYSGSIVHRVTPQLDQGEIKTKQTCSLKGVQTLDEVILKLKKTSRDAWRSFLTKE